MKFEISASDKIFNMIWTAGSNSGGKIKTELDEGIITPDQIQSRAQELIEKDAAEIVELMKLKEQMEDPG